MTYSIHDANKMYGFLIFFKHCIKTNTSKALNCWGLLLNKSAFDLYTDRMDSYNVN